MIGFLLILEIGNNLYQATQTQMFPRYPVEYLNDQFLDRYCFYFTLMSSLVSLDSKLNL